MPAARESRSPPLCPRGDGARSAARGWGRCGGPEPAPLPPGFAGGTSGLPRVSHSPTAVPRAGVPSWGLTRGRGSAQALNLLLSGGSDPRPQTGLGVLAAHSSINTPRPGKILQKTQTLKGLPMPGRFPEPAGSPKIIVCPQCAGSLHPLGPDPAGSFRHHNLRDVLPTKFLRALQGPQTLLGPLECPNTTRSPMEPQIPQSLPSSEPSGVPRPCWVLPPHGVPETLQDLPQGTLKDA